MDTRQLAAFCEVVERRSFSEAAAKLGVTQPAELADRLAERRAAAVPPDRCRVDPVQLEQLQRLRVLARGDLDLVTALAEQPDQRLEDQDVRRVGEVDPDAHQSRRSGGSPSARSNAVRS